MIKFSTYDNFPVEGVKFIDFTESYFDVDSRDLIVKRMVEFINAISEERNISLDDMIIVAPEARGFILGSIVADKLSLPLSIIRKKGKLPPEAVGMSSMYNTEYSVDFIDIHKSSKFDNKVCIFIDDVYATGGTYRAVKSACGLLGAIDCIPLVVYDVDIDKDSNDLYYLYNATSLGLK